MTALMATFVTPVVVALKPGPSESGTRASYRIMSGVTFARVLVVLVVTSGGAAPEWYPTL